jgi:hypothetical protein
VRALLAISVAAAAALAAIAAAVYGHEAALGVVKILLPLGVLTVLAAAWVTARRARLGGLRRQLAVIALIALAQMAIAVALLIRSMFVSSHDAFFAVIAVAYGTLLLLCVAAPLTRGAFTDLSAIRDALRRVGAGERDVRIPVSGGGELAAVADDLEAMVEVMTDPDLI